VPIRLAPLAQGTLLLTRPPIPGLRARQSLERQGAALQSKGERRFHGFKFRRQVPLGPYIIDFLCVEKNLIIEIDGDSHYEQGAQERDEKREAYLRAQGFDVLRVGNRKVVQELDTVLAKLGQALGYSPD